MEAGFIHNVSLEQKNDRDMINIENPSFQESMAIVPSGRVLEELERLSWSSVRLESGDCSICVCGGRMMPRGDVGRFIARLMITRTAMACSRGPNSLSLISVHR